MLWEENDENGPRTKTAPGQKRPQDKNGPKTKTALAVICYIVSLLTSKNIVSDASKCLFKQKHPFKGFKICSKKNVLACKMCQMDPDNPSNHS